MSRYELSPFNPDHEIAVGWDPGLGTYFAVVSWKDDRDENPLWVGTSPCEIDDPVGVLIAVSAYLNDLPPGSMLPRLQRDRANEGSRWAHGPAAPLLARPAALAAMGGGQRARVFDDLRAAGRDDLIPA